MNRSERRRNERAKGRDRVIIAGGNIVATPIPGAHYASENAAGRMPEKVVGQHRYVAMGSWTVTDEFAASAFNVETMKYLDHENLLMLSIGCWDCEQTLEQAPVGSICPRGDEWRTE